MVDNYRDCTYREQKCLPGCEGLASITVKVIGRRVDVVAPQSCLFVCLAQRNVY